MTRMDLFLRDRTVSLTDPERDRLAGLITDTQHLPARATLVERGQRLRQSTMLVSRFMIRFADDLHVERQVVAFQVPGDFIDLHGFPLQTLDHGIATLSKVAISTVPRAALEGLIAADPDLTCKLWFSILLDAAMHREWLFRLGHLDAVGRMSHFLAETEARLRCVGLSDGTRFALPISQSDVAEIVGLTSVHANRVLRTLREDGVAIFRSGVVEILDGGRITERGQFDPTYLYIAPRELRLPGDLERSLVDD